MWESTRVRDVGQLVAKKVLSCCILKKDEQRSVSNILYPTTAGKNRGPKPVPQKQNIIARCNACTHTHTYTHLHIHTHAHTHTHTQVQAALERVREGADVMPRSQLSDQLDSELGEGWQEKHLLEFDWQPRAAASIGQVRHGGGEMSVQEFVVDGRNWKRSCKSWGPQLSDSSLYSVVQYGMQGTRVEVIFNKMEYVTRSFSIR